MNCALTFADNAAAAVLTTVLTKKSELAGKIRKRIDDSEKRKIEITEESVANDEVGAKLEDALAAFAQDVQLERYRGHVDEVEKVTSRIFGKKLKPIQVLPVLGDQPAALLSRAPRQDGGRGGGGGDQQEDQAALPAGGGQGAQEEDRQEGGDRWQGAGRQAGRGEEDRVPDVLEDQGEAGDREKGGGGEAASEQGPTQGLALRAFNPGRRLSPEMHPNCIRKYETLLL